MFTSVLGFFLGDDEETNGKNDSRFEEINQKLISIEKRLVEMIVITKKKINKIKLKTPELNKIKQNELIKARQHQTRHRSRQ